MRVRFAKDPTHRSYRLIGAVIGVLLGIGAPYGYLLLHFFDHGRPSVSWYVREVSGELFTYAYLLIPSVLAFGLFGYWLGRLSDRLSLREAELERANIMLENQSITDDLTGLFNHRHILLQVDKEVERAKRYGRRLAGMMIDVDDFKSVNDCYGHLTGDAVIRELADLVGHSVRGVDIVGRFGGDEFLVILPEADGEAAKLVAERMLETIRKHPFKTGRDYIHVTVSIGVFSVSDPKDFEKSSFIDRIDRAMFYAKEQGKNRVHFSGPAA